MSGEHTEVSWQNKLQATREYVESILADVYLPEGVQIWMTSPHRQFDGMSAAQMIDAGRFAEVIAAAQSLTGQIAT